MKVFSAEQLHEADRITTEKHDISSLDLMERAGTEIFNWLHQRMQGAQVPVHIFCGIGNNGGDGLVIGRLLIQHGYNVNIYIANFTDRRSKCFLINYDRIKNITKKWPILMTSEKDFPQIAPEDVVIDAIFGIGLNRPPEGWLKTLIQYLNSNPAFKLSIDIPSGLYANKAIQDSEAILKANHTLTFQAAKLSFFMPESGPFIPYFEVLDIGLDPEYMMTTPPVASVITKIEARQLYRQREKFSHKGTYGHTLIAGGSHGKIGAIVLASRAAYKTGSGLVTAYIPNCGYNILQTAVPEAMTMTDKDERVLTDFSSDTVFTSAAIGMGLGQGEKQKKALKALFQIEKPVVIDADALNCLAENDELKSMIPEDSILTPHPGELKRLVGEWSDDYDKLEKAREFAKRHNCLMLVKGANTILIYKEMMFINTTGNPGMATGGSGDVLSGMIAALLSQGYDTLSAAIFGTYLHGSAGNLASQKMGFEALTAGEMIDAIGDAFLALFEPDQPIQPEDEGEKQ